MEKISSCTNLSTGQAVWAALFSVVLCSAASTYAIAAEGIISSGAATPPLHAYKDCSRPAAGSLVTPPPDLYISNGVLSVALDYYTALDQKGRTIYCFVTPDGVDAPTLHVKPGDVFKLAVTNHVPKGMFMEALKTSCGASAMYDSSLNVHFHGTLVSPRCTKDNVTETIINSGDTFQYTINIPTDEPPGMYWYHPHAHGIAEAALLGGASGALIVDGIESFVPKLSGMPQRVLLFRDQNTVGAINLPESLDAQGTTVPTWDVSLNNVPISYSPTVPSKPALIETNAGQAELWRVANASADSILDFQVLYDGVPQPLQVVGLDGVPAGSQDGSRWGKPITRNSIAMPPAARAEFVLQPPGPDVRMAVIKSMTIDTGPVGDSVPARTIAVIRNSVNGTALPSLGAVNAPWAQRFENLDSQPITAQRKLYFSEILSDPNNPSRPTDFFITEAGKTPVKYVTGITPAITTTLGNVEVWTIENHAQEKHVFHIHQIHFQLQEVNGVAVSPQDKQFYDDYTIDYWKGPGFPYPSIKVKMDFRGPVAGDFVYHCHILGHEDNGMMAVIRVLPKP